MVEKSTLSNTAASIRQAINVFRRSVSKLPTTESEAVAKLLAKTFSEDEIAKRRSAFHTNGEIDSTAILANYELLHGIKYIYKLESYKNYSASARAIIAIFRGAEVCLHNLAVLGIRISEDITADRIGDASVKIAWANHFNDTLYRLSQVLVQLDKGGVDGEFLDIHDSYSFQNYLSNRDLMHSAMQAHASESIDDLANKDIDDPNRFAFFHSYVNSNYEAIWLSLFEKVRLPGSEKLPNEDTTAFFRRVVQCKEVSDAVSCVDLKDSTYLMQFRAYHQISEILAALINDISADIIITLVNGTPLGSEDVEALVICNKLLQIVTDNIKPIVRNLSPKAYFAIRPALGITSGSHSHNLRKGLFLTIYPLLVRALRLNLVDFNDDLSNDDSFVLKMALEVLKKKGDVRAEMIRNVVYVYQYVRTWRDEHFQFIKTQIGISPQDVTPTASISGAENAALTANGFRSVHKLDAIAPLYEALLGKRPAEPLAILNPGGWDEYMAHFTAEAVQHMYADVQARVNRKHPADESNLKAFNKLAR